MSPKLYTTGEAAAAVKITRATVQAWIAEKKIQPPKATELGHVRVRMWTESDVEKLRQAKNRLYRKGRGRKPVKKRVSR
jgi:excisionase family DNA binding protein